MVGYVEQPIFFMSNMTALTAKDAAFTSAPQLHPLPLSPRNTVVQEFWGKAQISSLAQHPTPVLFLLYKLA